MPPGRQCSEWAAGPAESSGTEGRFGSTLWRELAGGPGDRFWTGARKGTLRSSGGRDGLAWSLVLSLRRRRWRGFWEPGLRRSVCRLLWSSCEGAQACRIRGSC